MAYDQLEPFGEERADERAGVVAALIANVNRRRGTRAFKHTDFMLHRLADQASDKASMAKNLQAALRGQRGDG